MYTKTHFSVSSPPQNSTQAVLCVTTPRMYPQNGYFLVVTKDIMYFMLMKYSSKCKYVSYNVLANDATLSKTGPSPDLHFNDKRK